MDFAQIEAEARQEFEAIFAAREVAIHNGRKIIRNAANAIRSIHRDDLDTAAELLAQTDCLLQEAVAAAASHAEINPGIVHDAAKEYAEARLFLAVVSNETLPAPSRLGVNTVSYLNGLGEVVGEMRRRMLDKLRDGQVEDAQKLLGWMDGVVDLLASFDYPEAMTGGLRRTTDAARGLTERSRADLTSTMVVESLRRDLADFESGSAQMGRRLE